MNKKIYQLDDRTMKYITMAQTKRQHQYLGLPEEFKIRLPQEVMFPNLESGRVDELYSTNKNLIINIEEESGYITEKTLEKFAKYAIFTSYRYITKRNYIYLYYVTKIQKRNTNIMNFHLPDNQNPLHLF